MEVCFKEMHRVLQDDGVMTVMFTHRTSEAWSSLASALMNAEFTFVSSWPVHTEPSDKYGKSGKGVTKSHSTSNMYEKKIESSRYLGTYNR